MSSPAETQPSIPELTIHLNDWTWRAAELLQRNIGSPPGNAGNLHHFFDNYEHVQFTDEPCHEALSVKGYGAVLAAVGWKRQYATEAMEYQVDAERTAFGFRSGKDYFHGIMATEGNYRAGDRRVYIYDVERLLELIGSVSGMSKLTTRPLHDVGLLLFAHHPKTAASVEYFKKGLIQAITYTTSGEIYQIPPSNPSAYPAEPLFDPKYAPAIPRLLGLQRVARKIGPVIREIDFTDISN